MNLGLWLAIFAAGVGIGFVIGSLVYRADLRRVQQTLADTFRGASIDALDANSDRFMGLAEEVLKKFNERAQHDLEKRQHAIQSLVSPVHETLERFDKKIQQVERIRAEAYGSLSQQIASLAEGERVLRTETRNLVHALRAPKVRGRWGEVQLRRVVEIAGMVEHCDFFEQLSMTTDEGRLRPDMIVKLPGQKQIIIDAKAVLEAYLDACEAVDENQKRLKLVEHSRNMRDRVRELSRKEYWKQFDETPEFVVMFLPGEPFYSAALEIDPTLIEHSVGQRVIIATPTTLIALLKAISYGWKQVALAENAEKISHLGKELHKRIYDFVKNFTDVGDKLGKAIDSYNAAVGGLERRMLVSARKFEDLKASEPDIELDAPEPIDKNVRDLQPSTLRLLESDAPTTDLLHFQWFSFTIYSVKCSEVVGPRFIRRSLYVLCIIGYGSLGTTLAHAWSSDDLMCNAHQSPVDYNKTVQGYGASQKLTHLNPVPPSVADLRHVRGLMTQGKYVEAEQALQRLEASYPRLRDRFSLVRGELMLKTAQPGIACLAFASAERSLDSGVAARARVGSVQCLLAAGNKRAESALKKLLKRYPELPDALALSMKLGQAREAWGDARGAAELYRSVDTETPGSELGRKARLALQALEKKGVAIPPAVVADRMDRVENLIRWGDLEEAQLECATLGKEELSLVNEKRLQRLVARVERLISPPAKAETPVTPAESEGQATLSEVGAKLTALSKGGNLKRLPTKTLLSTMSLAAAHGFKSVADDVLIANQSRRLPGRVRFQLGMIAAGLASEPVWVGFLTPLANDRKFGTASKYHIGRAYERMGKPDHAKASYELISQVDRSATRYYAHLSELRLLQLQQPLKGASRAVPDATLTAAVVAEKPRAMAASLDESRRALAEVVEKYGDQFPWFGRALDLITLGESEAAADELYEGYLAWRQALKRGLPRAGLEAVYCGRVCPRAKLDLRTRKARRNLDTETRSKLADVAMALGDVGTSLNFAGTRNLPVNAPRPYAAAVSQAAEAHHVDPELLYAVMRVESVYQKRIISYVGAIGLMQIMPRTGKLIAENMGHSSFTYADLLDAKMNVRMSAWYLSSLINRFGGSVPLAIAAYNGGPHNVRRWMGASNPAMPLDAFLELIPFGQTHNYVRRVFTHYVTNLAQSGKPLPAIQWELPKHQKLATVWF